MVLDTRVYRGPEIESDHYLVIAPIRIPPRWIQRKPRVLNKELSFRVELLQDPSIILKSTTADQVLQEVNFIIGSLHIYN
jgi:hypothetical protein